MIVPSLLSSFSFSDNLACPQTNFQEPTRTTQKREPIQTTRCGKHTKYSIEHQTWRCPSCALKIPGSRPHWLWIDYCTLATGSGPSTPEIYRYQAAQHQRREKIKPPIFYGLSGGLSLGVSSGGREEGGEAIKTTTRRIDVLAELLVSSSFSLSLSLSCLSCLSCLLRSKNSEISPTSRPLFRPPPMPSFAHSKL